MVTRILAFAAVIPMMAVKPAAAVWITYQDGTQSYIPNGAVFLFVLLTLCFGIILAMVNSGGSVSSTDDANESGSAEFYDSEAARFRAMSRKLDAETDLAENLIKAKRTRAELEEIAEMFRDGKTKRRP